MACSILLTEVSSEGLRLTALWSSSNTILYCQQSS